MNLYIIVTIVTVCAVVASIFELINAQIRREQARMREAESLHWQAVAAGILAKNPNADVSWCFARNRPPRRNPTAPAPRVGA